LHSPSLGKALMIVIFLKTRELSRVTSGLVLKLCISQGKSKMQPLMWRFRFVTWQTSTVSQRYVLLAGRVLYLSVTTLKMCWRVWPIHASVSGSDRPGQLVLDWESRCL